jgi:hypothetical protein
MAEIERLTTVWDARFDKFEEKLNRAVRATHGAAGRIEKRLDQTNDRIGSRFGNALNRQLDGVAQRAGPAADALQGLGAAGLAAGVAFGGLVIAINKAVEAMSFGDELQASADKLQITAESLQELQFAAEETDVPVEALRSGLEKLNGTIGAFKTGIGGQRVASAFAALGITKESLKDVHNATDLLPILADRLKAVGDTAAQVQIARKLGVEDLLPLLRQGSEGIAEMTARSRELGLVLSNQTIKALADADRQMELATRQIETNLRGAFVGLAIDIARATGALAEFLSQLRHSQEGWAVFLRTLGRVPSWVINGTVDAIPGGRRLRLANEAAGRAQSGRQLVADIRDALSQPLPTRTAAPTISGGGGGRVRSSRPTITPIEEFDAESAALHEALEFWRQVEARGKEAQDTFRETGLIPTTEAMADLVEVMQRVNGEAYDFGELLGDSITRGFDDLADSLANAIVYGKDLGDVLLNVFRSVSADILSESLRGLFSGGLKSVLGAVTGSIGGNAAGTDYWRGGPTWVGERGPEIVNLPRGAQVIPNHALQGAFRPASAVTNHNRTFAPSITVNISSPEAIRDRRRTGTQIAAETMKQLARAAKRTR